MRLSWLAILSLTLTLMQTIVVSEGRLFSGDEHDEENQIITVEPEYTKVPTGGEGRFECHMTLQNATLAWIHPNGTDVNEMNNSRFSYNGDGMLLVKKVELNDSGQYMCLVSNVELTFNATAELEVYVMPDYTKEGMIVLIINVVLIVIFCICLIQSTVRRRRSERNMRKTVVNDHDSPMLKTPPAIDQM